MSSSRMQLWSYGATNKHDDSVQMLGANSWFSAVQSVPQRASRSDKQPKHRGHTALFLGCKIILQLELERERGLNNLTALNRSVKNTPEHAKIPIFAFLFGSFLSKNAKVLLKEKKI